MRQMQGAGMKPFVHKNVIGSFFDALTPQSRDVPHGIAVAQGATPRKDTVLCVLAGELSLDRLPELATSLRKLLTSAVQTIVLDLSRVSLFSPNAVSVLVNFVSFVEGGGKRLVLFRPSRAVRNALDTHNLTHLFDMQQTEEDLLLLISDDDM